MKTALFIGMSLLSLSAFAGGKQVIGVAAICDCYERTIDGEHYLGKVGNASSARSADQAKNLAKEQCRRKDDTTSASFKPYIDNCTYSKAIQERVGKVMKSRIERIKDEEEDNLQNDLLGTL